MRSRFPQQSNISTSRENDVCHVSTIFFSILANTSCPHAGAYTHTCILTLTQLFFLLPYPYNLSHIVRKKSTLTQQPIIVFQETQNEIGEKTNKDCWVLSAAPLSRPTFDKQHHTSRIITENWNQSWFSSSFSTVSECRVYSFLSRSLIFYFLKLSPSFKPHAVYSASTYCIASKHWCIADFLPHIKAVYLCNAAACWLACFWICSLCQWLVARTL